MKGPLPSSSAILLLLLLGSCMSAATPCTSLQLAAPAEVKNTTGVVKLTEAINCSGGSFDVEWVGSVIVEAPIRLFGGTTLSITGAVDGTSVANGANIAALFEVDGGALLLKHLTLTNGIAERGGAIYATDAILTVDSCKISGNAGGLGGGAYLDGTVLETMYSSFTNNTASENGGAVYMKASNLTVGEDVLFEHNEASSGGALCTANSSILNLAGDNITFAQNIATEYGGGLYTHQSTTRLTGKSTLFGNTAEFGGAVFTDNSLFSVTGGMLLSNNFANDSGGAFYSGVSAIDIAGTIVWENNLALVGGGGLMLWETILHVQALGEAEFTGNTAGYGGAAYTSTSTLIVDGDVLFAENVVNLRGGGLYSDLSTINISGNALWENNRSPAGGGGGLLTWTSNVYVQRSGTAAFVGNTAYNGGAAYIDSSLLLSYGDTSFSTNVATADGGALYAGFSVVDIAGGSALWVNNTAGYGGGSLASFRSDAIAEASAKASFVSNAAEVFGGAVYASNSSLLFDGDVAFVENVAGETGGAIYSDLSVSVITGTTVWKYNSAQIGGGGLLMWNSTLHVEPSGTAQYFGNTANRGGAVYSYKSTSLFDGDVLFASNVVNEYGGGLYSDISAVNVTGTASWEDNISLDIGGGLALWKSVMHIEAGSNASFSKNRAKEGGGISVDEYAALYIAGLATFSRNSAENGGGIRMATLSTTSFSGGSVMMLGNTASSSGGGMHCESPTLLKVDGVQFVSNVAGDNGGAIMTLLAGTERVAEAEAEPATISNCWFSDNTAVDAGGAFFIGGGFVDITDSHFSNNYAGRSGGAILASGIVSLEDCVLEGNQAGVGSAVTNTVSVSFHSVEFINNTLLCDDSSFFLDWNETSSFAMACESCTGDCHNCTMENPNSVQQCQPVLDYSTSLDANGTLESLSIQQGFWRSSGTSKDIRECYEESACVGGTGNYCQEGYRGPLCAVCDDGYTGGLGYTCSECSKERRITTITIGVVLAAVVVAAAVRSLRFLGNNVELKTAVDGFSREDMGGYRPRFLRARASQALKIIVVSWQIVTQFSMVANVVYPDVYNEFLTYADAVNLNLGWILSAGCLLDTDFYDNLLVSTLVPLAIIAAVLTSHRVASARHFTSGRQTRARIDHRHASVLFWVSFLVYSTVSSAIFQTFACVDFDNGMAYLRADHNLKCYTSKHTLFRVYASVMGIVYPLGIPLFYTVILYRGRATLKDTVGRETSTTEVAVLRELWVAYRPEVYFYEVVECVRRAVLAGVIVFIFPNTAGQIATAFLLALFFAAVFMVLDPYTSWLDTWAARVGHIVVLMSMFVALLQKVDIGQDDNFSQNVFAIVLVLANCGMILAAAGEACAMCFVAVREMRQPVESLRTTAPERPERRISRHEELPVELTEEGEQAPF